MTEDQYEIIDIIVKSRSDGESWFNILIDYITSDCEGGGGDCIVEGEDESDCDSHEHTDIDPCTCGLESAGGMSGTLDQCYRSQGIADDLVGPINKVDLLRLLESFEPSSDEDWVIYNKLMKECTWWDEEWSEEEYGEEET